MSTSGLVFQIAMFVAIIYFAMVLPAQRRQKKRDEMLKAVKRGDEVVTAGGIIGEVVHIREVSTGEGATPRPMEDEITIKSGESRFIVERGKIARIVGGSSAPATKE